MRGRLFPTVELDLIGIDIPTAPSRSRARTSAAGRGNLPRVEAPVARSDTRVTVLLPKRFLVKERQEKRSGSYSEAFGKRVSDTRERRRRRRLT
jgi:hypothetical protein